MLKITDSPASLAKCREQSIPARCRKIRLVPACPSLWRYRRQAGRRVSTTTSADRDRGRPKVGNRPVSCPCRESDVLPAPPVTTALPATTSPDPAATVFLLTRHRGAEPSDCRRSGRRDRPGGRRGHPDADCRAEDAERGLRPADARSCHRHCTRAPAGAAHPGRQRPRRARSPPTRAILPRRRPSSCRSAGDPGAPDTRYAR